MKKRNKFLLCVVTVMSLFGSMSIAKVMAEEVQPRAVVVQAYYAGEPLAISGRSMRICADATVKNYSEITEYRAYWSVSGAGDYWFFDRGEITTTGSPSEYISKGFGKITYMGCPQKTGTCKVIANAGNA